MVTLSLYSLSSCYVKRGCGKVVFSPFSQVTGQGEMPQVVPREVQVGYNEKYSSLKEWFNIGTSCPGSGGVTIPEELKKGLDVAFSAMVLVGMVVFSQRLDFILEVFSNLYDSMSLQHALHIPNHRIKIV